MSVFSNIFGRMKNLLTADMRDILLDLSTGNADRDFAVGDISVESIQFDIDADAEGVEGTQRWNEAEHCPEYVTGLGNVVQLNKEIWDIGVNKTGAEATDGKVVYASDVQGLRFEYQYADARDPAKIGFVGVVTAPTAINAEGPVTAWGDVNDVNTSTWPAGTKLYVAADATGDLTDTPPPAPDFPIWVATVKVSHITQGSMFVAPRLDFNNGVTLKDLYTFLLRSGDLAGGNYSQFESDGTLKFNGDATVWDDLRIPLTQTRIGALLKPDFDTTNVGLLFPQNDASEVTYFIAQMPHAWRLESTIHPHIHWQQSAATAVTWKLDYKVFKPGAEVPAGFTTISGDTVEFSYTSGDLHQITCIGSGIDMSGIDGVSAVILGKLYRDDNTTTGDVLGFDIDFHYEIDTVGSRQEFVK